MVRYLGEDFLTKWLLRKSKKFPKTGLSDLKNKTVMELDMNTI